MDPFIRTINQSEVLPSFPIKEHPSSLLSFFLFFLFFLSLILNLPQSSPGPVLVLVLDVAVIMFMSYLNCL